MIMNSSGKKGQTSVASMIFSPINIATLLGIIFLVMQIPFPGIYSVVSETIPDALLGVINTVGAVTTPVSMMIIGMNLAKSSIREAFTDKDVITSSAMRLVFMPLMALGVVKLFGVPAAYLTACVFPLIISMPSPSASVMLSEQYGADVAFPSRITVLTSLMCIVTIPLFATLL